MKKIIIPIIAMMVFFTSSCSDMLEVDSGREIESPDINQASDSLFYVLGIIQAMQQAGDAYVLTNEVRGDLLDVTPYSDVNIQQLANFTATSENRYDSAYVYYRVINNCNYYLAHRDTTLMDGSYNVTRNEYAVVLTMRAWAYLQLVRNYGEVKFIDKPLESLSDIENDRSEKVGLNRLVSLLADEGDKALIRYTDCELPYGTWSNMGIYLIPVNVMLGELYLEAGRYAEAARCYYNYLLTNKVLATDTRTSVDDNKYYSVYPPFGYAREYIEMTSPNNWFGYNFNTTASSASLCGTVTMLAFSPDKVNGITSTLPSIFGYNRSGSSSEELYSSELQLVPSATYNLLADSSKYYIFNENGTGTDSAKYGSLAIGDQRAYERVRTAQEVVGNPLTHADTMQYVRLYCTGGQTQVYLYRTSTVWLHLAEAFNRMGYPDAAFAILKDGLTTRLLNYDYITDATLQLLTTTYPFLTGEGATVFSGTSDNTRTYGIHRHGCSDIKGLEGQYSHYQLSTESARKIAEIEKTFGVTAPSKEDSLAVLVNAVEDLLCDEYAMEFAFEGTRYADLMRLARHKNASSPAAYGANFGGRWLTNKLRFKTDKDFTTESNWYLPYN